jgi:hypothetical protein
MGRKCGKNELKGRIGMRRFCKFIGQSEEVFLGKSEEVFLGKSEE